MEWFRILLSRCAALFRRQQSDSELDDELRAHIEFAIEENLKRGMSAEAARIAAMRAFGGVTQIKETYRSQRGFPFLDTLTQDIRFALRQILRVPGVTLVAVLSLALGIGATTSMFSLIYAVLLHPVPYADWQRLIYPICLNDDQPGSPAWWFTLNWAQYQQLLKAGSVEDVVGSQNVNAEITGRDLPEDVSLTYVTENIGSFVRVPALLGRNLQPSDANASEQQAPAVLDYEFWMRRYNGDRNVLGQVLEIDHKPYTIVGVMPKNYTWWPDVYVPASLLPVRERNLLPVMKLKPGVSLATANAELDALLHRFAKDTPREFPGSFRAHLRHISDRVLDRMGRTLILLFVAVVILLIIGCANCSILLLARGIARQNEMAVRTALGASRYRILRQLLVEALLLAVTGSLMGIAFAYWLAKLTFSLFPDVFMHESVIEMNLPVLGFSIAVAVLSGILFGLIPSLRMSRPDVSQVMQTTAHKITGGVAQTRSLNALIAAQIALTIVMMGGAGAAIGSFLRLTHRNLGYDPSHVMNVPVPLHRNSLLARDARAAYFETLRQKIATVPGVTQVAISTNATPPSSGWNLAFEILGMPLSTRQHLRANMVGPSYFATLRIPLLEGRLWNETENAHGAAVAIINQTLAQRYFPKGNAVGQQIRIPDLRITNPDQPYTVGVPDINSWLQIIGVVGDSTNDGLDKPVLPAIYMPAPRFMGMGTQFLIRTEGSPLAALHDVRAAIQSVNPDQQAVRNVTDLEERLEVQPEWQQHHLFFVLFTAYSVLALTLALIGLYSVISYSVARRTNEFGIRMALGARRGHVLWIVSRAVAVPVGIGLAAGLLITVASQKLMVRWTENAYDPLILAAVILLFLLSAAGACILPALRATSIDPVQALRYE